jgi:hypothetical protein
MLLCPGRSGGAFVSGVSDGTAVDEISGGAVGGAVVGVANGVGVIVGTGAVVVAGAGGVAAGPQPISREFSMATMIILAYRLYISTLLSLIGSNVF